MMANSNKKVPTEFSLYYLNLLFVIFAVFLLQACGGQELDTNENFPYRYFDDPKVIERLGKSLNAKNNIFQRDLLNLPEIERQRTIVHSPLDINESPVFMSYMNSPFALGEKTTPAVMRAGLLIKGFPLETRFTSGSELNLRFYLAKLHNEDVSVLVKITNTSTKDVILEKSIPITITKQWAYVDLPFTSNLSQDIECSLSAEGPGAVAIIGEPMLIENGAPSELDGPPNIILITIDTFRGDSHKLAGYQYDTTPRIDSIASDGVFFENVYSHSGHTPISHQTTLSGFHSISQHYLADGMEQTTNYNFPPSIYYVADVLRSQGYITAEFAEWSGTFGGTWRGMDLTQRSGHYSFDAETKRYSKNMEWDQTAIPWLKEAVKSKGPFFLFLHTMSAHDPYFTEGYENLFNERETGTFDYKDFGWGLGASSNIESKTIVDLISREGNAFFEQVRLTYDRGLRVTDDRIGNFYDKIKELGYLENTILIVASDHGERFGTHGMYNEFSRGLGHGTALHTDLSVPLLIAGEGIESKGKIVEQQVSLLDLAPTIFDLAKIEYSPLVYPGKSMYPLLLDGEESDSPRYHLSYVLDGYNVAGNPWFGINFQNEKLMVVPLPANKGKSRLVYSDSNQVGPSESISGKQVVGSEGGVQHENPRVINMKGALLAAIGEGIPGWKVLVIPKSGSTITLNNAAGYQKDGRPLGKLLKFSEKHQLRIAKNVKNAKITFPTLLLYDSEIDDHLAFELFENDSPVNVNVLGAKLQTQISPLRISASKVGRPKYGDILELLAQEDFYGVYIWYGPIDFKMSEKIRSGELSDEEIMNLRDLGYIQ
jgi:arylsulfatase A-like enzyme